MRYIGCMCMKLDYGRLERNKEGWCVGVDLVGGDSK